MVHHVYQHLDDEERHWPAVIEKHGQVSAQRTTMYPDDTIPGKLPVLHAPPSSLTLAPVRCRRYGNDACTGELHLVGAVCVCGWTGARRRVVYIVLLLHRPGHGNDVVAVGHASVLQGMGVSSDPGGVLGCVPRLRTHRRRRRRVDAHLQGTLGQHPRRNRRCRSRSETACTCPCNCCYRCYYRVAASTLRVSSSACWSTRFEAHVLYLWCLFSFVEPHESQPSRRFVS